MSHITKPDAKLNVYWGPPPDSPKDKDNKFWTGEILSMNGDKYPQHGVDLILKMWSREAGEEPN